MTDPILAAVTRHMAYWLRYWQTHCWRCEAEYHTTEQERCCRCGADACPF